MTEKDKVINTRDKTLKTGAALVKEAKERFRLTENYTRVDGSLRRLQ